MKIIPSSPTRRSLLLAAGVLVLAALLAGAFSSSPGKERGTAVFHGVANLPLSGDLAGAGDAFRAGFSEGLDSVRDSLFAWRWEWTDNGSDPLLAQAWADTVGRTAAPDLLLAGLGSAIEELRLPRRNADTAKIPRGSKGVRAESVPCLLLGDGTPRGDGVWNLWPTADRVRARLLERLRDAPRPLVIFVVATGSWADIVLTELRDSLPESVILPHDLDNARWDAEIKRLWETRPGTVLFWDRPREASALLAKPLAVAALRKAKLLVPEGTVVPDSLEAQVMAPVWQPDSPPDSLQCARYRDWGREVGASLARATRLALVDSLGGLLEGLRRLSPDTLARESWARGWSPLPDRGVSRSVAPKSDPGH